MDLLCTSIARSMKPFCCRRWMKPICSIHLIRAAQQKQSHNKNLTTSTPKCQRLVTHCLQHRTLLRFSGKDTSEFLQGLLTNDMECLHARKINCGKTLYALMLNVQGRVLYDLIMYAVEKQNPSESSDIKDAPLTELLMECDVSVREELIKTFKRYKIRKKVDITPVGDEVSVWSAFTETPTPGVKVTNPSQLIMCEPDPRLKTLGYRLLLPAGVKASSVLADSTEAEDESAYLRHRYQQGVAEGSMELPPGGCLPLESNAAFLNGVSFNKGCYVGQELTARTFHTGLTRKRIMPLSLDSEFEAEGKVSLENAVGKRCGTLRGVSGSYGLGLLRIPDTIGKGPLTLKDKNDKELSTATTHIPDWWSLDTDTIIKQAITDYPDAVNKAK